MKKFKVTVNGQAYDVEVEDLGGALVSRPDAAPAVKPVASPVVKPAAPAVTVPKPVAPAVLPKEPIPEGAVTVNAPMPGKISAVKLEAGAAVKRGDVILVLEAMKMQNDITAPQDGTLGEIRVAIGDNVKTGDVLAVMA